MNAQPTALTAWRAPRADALRLLRDDSSLQIDDLDSPLVGLGEISAVLWRRYLRHNPANPRWPDRDRLVLTPGRHTSSLQSPLQSGGLVDAFGAALAEVLLAAEFNRPGYAIVDHRTYAILDEGLRERTASVAAAVAGAAGLHRLIAFYDVGVRSDVEPREDAPGSFEARGWNVLRDINGLDAACVEAALSSAHGCEERPTLICYSTSAPLPEERNAARGCAFGIPGALRTAWDGRARGRELEQSWRERFHEYGRVYPRLAVEFAARINAERSPGWQRSVDELIACLAKDGGTVESIARAAQDAMRAASH